MLRRITTTQAYCFWGENTVFAPFYGAAFVSEFLGSDGSTLMMLDDGSGAVAIYAVFAASGSPVRLLVINTDYFDGTGARSNATVSFTGLSSTNGTKIIKRLTAPNATSQVSEDATAGTGVAIGGNGTFNSDCIFSGGEEVEEAVVSGNSMTITVAASESLIVYL